jgi:hypothetical protein
MEWSMEKTMSFANAISGKVVSREGASLPDAEIMKVYDELSSSAV